MKFHQHFAIAIALIIFFAASAIGARTTVSNLYVPIEGTVFISDTEAVSLSGQVHVLTRVTFSDTFLPAVQMYVNLIGVHGTSNAGRSFVLVGGSNGGWTGLNPGPPDIPEQTFNFSLVQINPGPPDLPPSPVLPPSPIIPVYLSEFTFAQEAGFEGSLQNVVASFVSEG